MSHIQALETASDLSSGDLRRFQKDVVRVVLNLDVKDDDGTHLCKLSAGTAIQEKPLATMRSLMLQFVEQWIALHDSLIKRVRDECRFGHLNARDIQMMDVITATGTLLLSGLRHVHTNGEDGPPVGDHIMDMTHSLKAMAMLQLSYEKNPPNEELASLAVMAAR